MLRSGNVLSGANAFPSRCLRSPCLRVWGIIRLAVREDWGSTRGATGLCWSAPYRGRWWIGHSLAAGSSPSQTLRDARCLIRRWGCRCPRALSH